MGNFLGGAIIATALCYWAWGGRETYIENVEAHEDGFGSATHILRKIGSGQVAVFHGFVMDDDACQTAAKALERQGGYYECAPASTAIPVD
ncbi:hypothetical protein [Phaeobacter inhibens]|uniref:hypothetical protein n=1 Tax=Phaeobacter inhibens TaxID=221822 RepID=UPI000CA3A232|nr:hypothetical protein [Phaeobacter inhibens]AUQ64409.1 hypothetical protein PhaeoP51_03478 [Phaeobacter inhibens]AUQ89846.1 hypothetical protein PhaeoP24_01218 [Phaeobacter inhibens]